MPVHKDVILRELEELPDASLHEVLDFIRFLKAQRAEEITNTAQLSEQVLGKDWLTAEEDEAWRDL